MALCSPGAGVMTVCLIAFPQWWIKAIMVFFILLELWYFAFRIKTISPDEAREYSRMRLGKVDVEKD